MKILGIELRRPSFAEVTTSGVMATGLWLAYVGLSRAGGQPFIAADAGAALLVIFWGCVCVRLGIRVDHGPRHLALNLLLGSALLLVYEGVLAFAA